MNQLEIRYHFLLQFADWSQLKNMTNDDRVRLVSKIIISGKNETSWGALQELFSSWQDNPSRKQGFEIAEGLLADWKEEDRTIYSSTKSIFQTDKLVPFTLLARKICINRREGNGNQELVMIASSPYAKNISQLVIDRSEIYIEGISSLVQSSWMTKLSSILFNGISLLPSMFETLINSRGLIQLRSLTLSNCGINAERVRQFTISTMAGQLETLNFSRNTIGDEGAFVIAKASTLAKLKRLDVSKNFIGDAGAVALAGSVILENLEELRLSGNTIYHSGELQRQVPEGKKRSIYI